MVFKRFKLQVVGRILLISLTISIILFFAFIERQTLVALLFGFFTIIQVVSLINYVDKTNRDLNLFLQSINHDDFSVTFDSKKYGATFKDLEEAFTKVTSRFLKIRSEKEENFRYLQTVVQHVGTGLISYLPNGEVELINSVAKKLLNINHLKNLKSLETISKPLADTLFSLKPGESSLLEVEMNGRTAFMSINATQFKLQAKVYTLVSIQDIQSEIERERMATELNIAYQVQKSLLPRSNPILSGYDIVGLCIPAKEVGGDYYDFFPLEDNKLGIVIGDVSGKGVPAAIYMTLTKGIIQSHTHNLDSPGEVLKNVNKLLYQILEPGNFVSMFFAVLDGNTGELSCARAGHNEAILYSSTNNKVTNIQPGGIGLGLEKGDIFDSKIKEQTIHLNPNDILIFYTDGFTEAMNHQRELFGETRLQTSLLKNQDKKMVDLVQSVSTDVKNFVGKSSQFDDMTIIGIKAL